MVGWWESLSVRLAKRPRVSPGGAHIEQRTKIEREKVVNNIGSGRGDVGHNSNFVAGDHPSYPHQLISQCLSTSWKPTVGVGRFKRSSSSSSSSSNISLCSSIH